jgi:hypothetical protein
MFAAPPSGAPTRLVDVYIMMWCGKEGMMMAEPYQYMADDNVRACMKDQMKKNADDDLKIMFVYIMFEIPSPQNMMYCY